MLKLLKSGFFTTVQDNGRYGHRAIGVPIAGAMDMLAFNKANALLENERNAAMLEITMTGPTIIFDAPTYIVLAGADMSTTLNNEPVINYKVIKIKAGDILSYGRLGSGFRSYLAVKDGLKTKQVMGSRSFFKHITPGTYLKNGSELAYDTCVTFKPKVNELKVDAYVNDTTIEVWKGPEYHMLSDKQLETIFTAIFTVSKENNRMAYQLNEVIEGHKKSMITSATLPGTVQFTPSGKLIILMKDGQTTGGYPRLLQLTEKAMSILAQKKLGDAINFKLLSRTQVAV